MGSLFSKHKKSPKPAQSRITQQDEAILQLKSQRDKMKQYQRRIEANLEKERNLAKQLIKADKKDRALLLLKKKRYQENLIEKTEKQMNNIEQMIHDVEFAQIQMQVMDGLKAGNDCLHKMHDMMSIEDVERILDETKEAVEYQHQIDELISGQLTAEDQEDIENELEDLLKETQQLPEFPRVPEDQLPVKEPSKTREKRPERTLVAAS